VFTVTEGGDIEMEIGAVTVTEADAIFDVSATLTAVTVTAAGEAGAVYSPALDIVPTVELPPFTPFTFQVIPVLTALVTVAVNCLVCPVWTIADTGDTDMETGVGLIVTVAEANAVGSFAIFTVTLTSLGEGGAAGAVYSPAVEIVPAVESPPETPFTDQISVGEPAPVTFALNCTDCPTVRVA
jgi:hypothetical protein